MITGLFKMLITNYSLTNRKYLIYFYKEYSGIKKPTGVDMP